MLKNQNCFIKKLIFIILSALNIAFIFFQSVLPADTSGAESGYIVELFNSISEFFGFGRIFTNHFVRKLAHFSEFALLGILLSITFSLYKNSKRKIVLISTACCLLIAVSDEFIQLFSQGRACCISDMLLDFSGSLFGILMFLLISFMKILIWSKNYDRNKAK